MKHELARFGHGFLYAWTGIRTALLQERNIRFHLCAAAYALAVGCLAELDAMGFALLFLCIFGVLGMEMMNSAVERAVDKPDTTHWWSAGAAKDMAAGAVLLTAAGAVAVAVCLFGNAAALARIWAGVTHSPITVMLWLVSFGLSYIFIFCFGGSKREETTDAETK